MSQRTSSTLIGICLDQTWAYLCGASPLTTVLVRQQWLNITGNIGRHSRMYSHPTDRSPRILVWLTGLLAEMTIASIGRKDSKIYTAQVSPSSWHRRTRPCAN